MTMQQAPGTGISPGGFSPNGKSLTTGIALMTAGSLIGLAGAAVCGVSLISATRRWIANMEVPPREIARQKWTQARAAAAAGAGAWRDGSPAAS